MLAIATDYAHDTGCPEPALRRIAEAGFSRVHWCHHWSDDFLYSDVEVDAISRWLADYHLSLDGVHATTGAEKRWTSSLEYERLAGVELVKNRISLAQRLGGDVIVIHPTSEEGDKFPPAFAALTKSLDELEPFARRSNVRLALENGDFAQIQTLFSRYSSDFLGLCFDSGHANLAPFERTGLDHLEKLKDRLLILHLHDNNGLWDQHIIPFSGTIDWDRLARILAGSPCADRLTLETLMQEAGIDDEAAFLAKAHEVGVKLSDMVQRHRPKPSP
ncbi:MAG: sugar phosphate isomerase/epimerase family protein [Planctomycetota bacterium]